MNTTYGRVSRYGAMPLSHSLDHIVSLTRSVIDFALITQIISGYDSSDSTSARKKVPDYMESLGKSIEGLKIGVPDNYFDEHRH